MGNTRSSFPQRVVIELTPRCNLSCSICPRHHVDKLDGFITKELWKKLIDEIAGISPEIIVLPFWRGESLLHPQFAGLMKYAQDRAIRFHISTNGRILKNQQADILRRCEFVSFSVHDELGYKHAKAFQALKRSDRPAIQISFVDGEETEGILKSIVAKADLDGFDSVRRYEEHTKDGIFGKSDHSGSTARTRCPKLNDTLVISCDGTVSRCNHIWVTEEKINVNAVRIKDAWFSPLLKKIRETYPDEQCAPCDQWTGHTRGESWRLVDGRIVNKVYGSRGMNG